MLPNFSGLQLARTTLLDPRVVPIGVYADSPPDSTKLRIVSHAAAIRMFDALGPFLGVQMRLIVCDQPGKNYDLTAEDHVKVQEFKEAAGYIGYKDVLQEISIGRMDTFIYRATRDVIYELAIERNFDDTMREALYELHIFYIRYVWNFKLPGSDAPLDREVQKKAWRHLRLCFKRLETCFMIRITLGRSVSLDQPDANTLFTKSGTPMVNFPLENWRNSDEQNNASADILYEMLIAYWSARAKVNWKNAGKSVNRKERKERLLARINEAWVACYTEVHFRPGNRGAKRAHAEFVQTMMREF